MKHQDILEIDELKRLMDNFQPQNPSTFAIQFILGNKGEFDVASLQMCKPEHIQLHTMILDWWLTRRDHNYNLPTARFHINAGIFNLALRMMVPFAGELKCCVYV